MAANSNTFDSPSPDDGLLYAYTNWEQYLESNPSESQSPLESPFDTTYFPDLSSTSDASSSPFKKDGRTPAQGSGPQNPAPKRKRENRYKNAPPSVLSRRRAQNRASQRAYRERKDQRIKDLEQLLDEATQRNDVLSQAYAALHAEYTQLKAPQSGDYDAELLLGTPVPMAIHSMPDMAPAAYADMSQPHYGVMGYYPQQ